MAEDWRFSTASEDHNNPDSKIVAAPIWARPDTFIWTTCRLEWWQLGGPLLFARFEPQAGHTTATCQPGSNQLNRSKSIPVGWIWQHISQYRYIYGNMKSGSGFLFLIADILIHGIKIFWDKNLIAKYLSNVTIQSSQMKAVTLILCHI